MDTSNADRFCPLLPGVAVVGLSGGDRMAIAYVIDRLNVEIEDAVDAANAALGCTSSTRSTPIRSSRAASCVATGTINPGSFINPIVNPVHSPMPENDGPFSYSVHPNALGHRAYERRSPQAQGDIGRRR